jgi:hypothetical protein
MIVGTFIAGLVVGVALSALALAAATFLAD